MVNKQSMVMTLRMQLYLEPTYKGGLIINKQDFGTSVVIAIF